MNKIKSIKKLNKIQYEVKFIDGTIQILSSEDMAILAEFYINYNSK